MRITIGNPPLSQSVCSTELTIHFHSLAELVPFATVGLPSGSTIFACFSLATECLGLLIHRYSRMHLSNVSGQLNTCLLQSFRNFFLPFVSSINC